MVTSAIGAIVAASMAAVLLRAGTEKLRDGVTIRGAAVALGVPPRWSRVTTTLLAVFELGVALGLLMAPGSTTVQLATGTLALVFAAAGGWALARNRKIRCGCFGPAGTLGRAQLWALPAWGTGIAWLSYADPPVRSLAETFAWVAGLAAAMALWRLPVAWRASRLARGDRQSASEMISWIP